MRIKALSPESDRLKDVLLDGKSVFHNACDADDVEGWAMVYDREAIAKVDRFGGDARAFDPVKVSGKGQFIFE